MRHFLSAVKEAGVTSKHLKKLNISSVFHITRHKEQDFIQHTSGTVSEEQARTMYKAAKNIHNQVLFKALSAKTVLSKENFTEKFSTSSNGQHFIKNDASYENVFGSLDYYSIDDDDSILSPAAYFVDLYNLIEQQIKFNDSDKQASVYKLENRRPDLKQIPLDKASTETLKSYLEIANNIVEQFLINYPNGDLPIQESGSKTVLADDWALKQNIPFTQPLLEAISNLEYLGVKLADIYSLTGQDQATIDQAILGIGLAEELAASDIQLNDLLNQIFNVANITSDSNNAGTIAQSLKIEGDEVDDTLFSKLAAVKQLQEQLDLSVTEVANLIYPAVESSRYPSLSNALGETVSEIMCAEKVLGYADGETPNTPEKLLSLVDYFTSCKDNNINTYQVYYITQGSFYSSVDNQSLAKFIGSLLAILNSTNDNWQENLTKALSAQSGVGADTIEVVIGMQTRAQLIANIGSIVRNLFAINCFALSTVDVSNIQKAPAQFHLGRSFAWNSAELSLEDIGQFAQLNTLKAAYHSNIAATTELSDSLVKDTSVLPQITGYDQSDLSTMYGIVRLESNGLYPVVRQDINQDLDIARSELVGARVGNYAIFAGGRASGGSLKAIDIYDTSDPDNIHHVDISSNTELLLSEGRYYLSGVAVGNYAIFAGGISTQTGKSDVVDIYDFSNFDGKDPNTIKHWSSLDTKDNHPDELMYPNLPLSDARYTAAINVVQNYVIVAGGNNGTSRSVGTASVDIYDFSNFDGKDPNTIKHWSSLDTKDNHPDELIYPNLPLSQARYTPFGTSVGSCVIIAGGNQGVGHGTAKAVNTIDIYDFSNFDGENPNTIKHWSSLDTKDNHPDELMYPNLPLSSARYGLVGTAVGNYAIFAGGLDGNDAAVSAVDIYDFSNFDGSDPNTISRVSLSAGSSLVIASGLVTANAVGNYAIFAGGSNGGNANSKQAVIYDFTSFDGAKQETIWGTSITLNESKSYAAAAAVDINNLAFIAGGVSNTQYSKTIEVLDLSLYLHDLVSINKLTDTLQSMGSTLQNFKDVYDKDIATMNDYVSIRDNTSNLVGKSIKNTGEQESVTQDILKEILEKKRNALATTAFEFLGRNAYTYDVKNLRNLYEYFLIDIQTNAKELISELKLGLNSLQTYIQRVLMNLEPNITSVDIDSELWSWMSAYRMWQANREVFLYPENYFDPSLRKDATPEYQHLIQTLSQQPITQDNVNDGYSEYFHDFDIVSNLDIVDYSYSFSDPKKPEHDDNTLFILGRTQSAPYQYYYRTGYLNEDKTISRWDAWKEIKTTIPSAYVSITYAFERWFLFWVDNTTENTTTSNTDAKQLSSYATIKYIYLQINNTWSAEQILKNKLLYAVNNAEINDSILNVYNPNPNDKIWAKLNVRYDDSTKGKIIIGLGPLIPLELANTKSDATFPVKNPTSSPAIQQLNTNFINAFSIMRQENTSDNLDSQHFVKLFSYTLSSSFEQEDGQYIMQQLNSKHELETEREDLAATNVGNYALFGGGMRGGVASKEVNIFDFSNNAVRIDELELDNERYNLVATSVGNYALFGGGKKNDGSSAHEVDIFDFSEFDGHNIGLIKKYNLSLSKERQSLAATSVGNYALFGGGYIHNKDISDEVDIFDFSTYDGMKASSIRQGVVRLSSQRYNLSATSVGNYVLFGGGALPGSNNYSGEVDIFDLSKVDPSETNNDKRMESIQNTRITVFLEEAADLLSATSVGNYAIFAGGGNSSNSSVKTKAVTIFDLSTFNGTKESINSIKTVTLHEERAVLSATSVGNYAIFAGGYNKDEHASNVVDIYDFSQFTIADAKTLKHSVLELDRARQKLAATSVGNYALFGGGKKNDNVASKEVDIFDINGLIGDKPQLSTNVIGNRIPSTILHKLSQEYLANGASGLFNIRKKEPSLFNALMCNTNASDAPDTLNRVEGNLKSSRSWLSGASVGNYAIFAGGYNNSQERSLDAVDIYNFATFDGINDTSITHWSSIENPGQPDIKLVTALFEARGSMGATSSGNYSIFAGGYNNDKDASKVVDIYDFSNADGENPDTIRRSTLDKAQSLSEERYNLAATSVGNYSIFAGGLLTDHSTKSKAVDIYDLSTLVSSENTDGTFIHSISHVVLPEDKALYESRELLSASAIKTYAIFAGGAIDNDYSDVIDIYDFSKCNLDSAEPENTITHWNSVTSSIPKLSQARGRMGAARVGNYLIFAGGFSSSGKSDVVDIYDFSKFDGTDLTKIGHWDSINNPGLEGLSSYGRYDLAATSVGNYAIFAGGNTSSDPSIIEASNTVDIYDFSQFDPDAADPVSTIIKTNLTDTSLSEDVSNLTALSVGNYAMFAGGENNSGAASDFTNIFDIRELERGSNKVFCRYYKQYLWEIFYHIPLFIAEQLHKNDQFADAKTWYEYVFNPITNDNDYWNFGPFIGSVVDKLRTQLSDDSAISTYEENPLDPEAIANLRPGAFEKFVVMKYIDNLIAWGDSLFSQYSWENVAHARILYVMAYDLLGPKPFSVGDINNDGSNDNGGRDAKDLSDILTQENGDPIPQFLIDLEKNTPAATIVTNPNIFNSVSVLAYFGVPSNDQLSNYWSVIEDRLYKIRNSENINGTYQQLPLFQPPIDPNSLVSRDASAYLNGANDLYNPLDIYAGSYPLIGRFKLAISQARNVTETVSAFGNAILSAYEKRDSDTFTVLQENQSQDILNLMTQIKKQEIEQAQDNISALTENLQSAIAKVKYYSDQLNLDLSFLEIADLGLVGNAIDYMTPTPAIRVDATVAHLIPTIFGFSDGGSQPGSSIDAAAGALDSEAGLLNASAGNISKQASYERRAEEWQLQKTLAEYEQSQIQAQLNANNIALASAKQNLVVHQRQITQSKEKLNFLKSKFTNTELYEWMYGQLLSVYNTAYQYAFSAYLAAVRSYQFEINDNPKSIATSKFYQSRKGILAGEMLKLSINQLEQDYYAVYNNKVNVQQLEKTISLKELKKLSPNSVTWPSNLDNSTEATWLFNLQGSDSNNIFKTDFPQLTCFRIKTISVSFPAIVGPYQNIPATLHQTEYLIDNLKIKPNGQESDDNNRTYKNWIKRTQIALSRNIDDSGLFQLDFHDDNYLPFEGTGARSKWELKVHNLRTTHDNIVTNSDGINFDNISDIIIKISYTAEQDPNANGNHISSLQKKPKAKKGNKLGKR